jgi:nitroreductase
MGQRRSFARRPAATAGRLGTVTVSSAEADEPFDDLVRRRRTSLLVDPERPVPDAVIDELIDAATWAPNHKRTWPWRFTVLTGDARARFGAALGDAAETVGLPEAKVAKLRTKYLRSPVLLLVWVARNPGDDPVRMREDRDATAAAVQNLLLAATARGLASYWGSLPEVLVPAGRQAVGMIDVDPVALIYLGWPTSEVPAPSRPDPEVTWLSS